MKKILGTIAALCLCAGCSDPNRWFEGSIIWNNASSHTVRITAASYYNNYDVTLTPKSSILFEEHDVILWLEYQKLDIYFGDTIHVPYESRNGSTDLFPPEGFPEQYNVGKAENWSHSQKEERTHYEHTWTYTFTNADYEAAKAWSERQP